MALALAGCLSALAGCDFLLGLGDYSKCTGTNDNTPDCIGADSGSFVDVRDAGLDADGTVADTGPDTEAGAIAEGGGDADAGDADVLIPGDGAIDGPTLHEIWAHWPMPNPDAAIGPDSSLLLPHTMSYDAGPDAGASVVYDNVTGLTWQRASDSATTFDPGMCQQMHGAGWRVPTRIELVSLIDFTQPASQPTIDPFAFPGTQAAVYWTSSIVPGDGGPAAYWTVSFGTGIADFGMQASWVRCVSGGTP